MAVSYSPTSVPSGPLMRCNSSWMIRSGGRRGLAGTVRAAPNLPSLVFGWLPASSISGDRNPCRSQKPSTCPKSICGLALPRHLGELVHRGDQEGGELAVDLLIDHQDRDAPRPGSAAC